jgi:hypothetical protein
VDVRCPEHGQHFRGVLADADYSGPQCGGSLAAVHLSAAVVDGNYPVVETFGDFHGRDAVYLPQRRDDVLVSGNLKRGCERNQPQVRRATGGFVIVGKWTRRNCRCRLVVCGPVILG